MLRPLLQVFTFLSLLYRGRTEIEAPKLAWTSALMGDCQSSTLTATSAIMPVPANYDPETSDIKLNMFVKRYMTKGARTVSKHLIMLPGGPGQDETILESHVSHLERFIGGPIAIYLPDLRCVGQSQSFVQPGDYTWTLNPDRVAQASPIPLTAITLSNAAHDIILLARAIKSSPEFVLGGKLCLFGVSFGATWAYRILQLDKNSLFHSVILDSIAPLEGLVAPENDEGLLRNCNEHPYCKEQFDGDAKNSRKMLETILQPKFNECTAQLDTAFKNKDMFHPTFSPLYKFYILVQPALEGLKDMGNRTHSAELVMGLIKATHQCADPTNYSKILKVMLLEATSGGAGAKPASTPSALKMRGSLAGEMNMVLNYIFFISEAYNIPNGGNAKCGPMTLSHQCVLYSHYKDLYEGIKKYVTPRYHNATSSFRTNAKVFFVHGEIDMLAPAGPAMRFADKIQGTVRKLVYRNLGHSMISGGDCAPFIFDEAINDKSSTSTDKCLAAVNSVPLDWTLRKAPEFQDWWDRKITVTYIADPVVPTVGQGLSTWILIIISIVVILLIAGIGIFVKMRGLNKKTM